MSSNHTSLEDERIILGAMLVDISHYWEVANYLEAGAFSNDDYKSIFTTIKDMADNNIQPRIPAISTKIDKFKDGTEPAQMLSAMAHSAKKSMEDTMFFATEIANHLQQLYAKRQIEGVVGKIQKKLSDVTQDPMAILDDVMIQVSSIIQSADKSVQNSVGEVLKESLDLINEAHINKGIGLDTGLLSLDDMIGKMFPGDMIILGGSPGGGKTSLATQIAFHVAKGEHIGFFELEMENRMLMLRTLSTLSNISVRDMLDGINEEKFDKIMKSAERLKDRKMTMISNHQMTLEQIESHIRKMKREHDTKLVVIDHIGIIKSNDRWLKGPDKVYAHAEALMKLGKQLGVTMLCLCHLTKGARQKLDPEPTMEDFYGGGLEQHADLMICNFNRENWLDKNRPPTMGGKLGEAWLEKKTKSKGKMEIHKLKDRKGSMHEIKEVQWIADRTLFKDLPSVVEQQNSMDLLEPPHPADSTEGDEYTHL